MCGTLSLQMAFSRFPRVGGEVQLIEFTCTVPYRFSPSVPLTFPGLAGVKCRFSLSLGVFGDRRERVSCHVFN